jgi:predicted GNAT family acetyltransferase
MTDLIPDDDAAIRDNAARSRYELETEKGMAVAEYERRGAAIAFTHTHVPAALRGHGLAERLIAAGLADVRRQGLKLIPLCSYVAEYLDRHAEQQDLIAVDAPG